MTSFRISTCSFVVLWFSSTCLLFTRAQHGNAAEQPNVILFIADDVSWNDYGCYGNPHARTPHIDQLASDGIRFTKAYLTASSCSPSRSSIVTGRYPHNTGRAAELHLPIAANLPWFPELLKEAGYYTALSGKNHLSVDRANPAVEPREKAFDLVDPGRTKANSGGHANWVKVTRERPMDRPFFFWFAAYDAHRGWDADQQWQAEYGPRHTPSEVVVPPFLVDSQATREDLASYYNEVTRFDYYIGQVVAELKSQGVWENTLIFVMADNGRPFPRAKTRLHDSGMQTALVAHWPGGMQVSGTFEGLASVIDLAPTILKAAGVQPAATMQGVPLQAVFQDLAARPRKVAFSEHNWHDYAAHGRSVRDGRFLYIKNNRPYAAWQGPADSVRSPSHLALQKYRDDGRLTDAQKDVFLDPRPAEELYLVDSDSDQVNNLVNSRDHQKDLQRLRALLAEWTDATGDTIPERISQDYFDRESGKKLPIENEAYRGTTPGAEKNASQINASGPH